MCEPRPLQVKSSAPAGGVPSSAMPRSTAAVEILVRGARVAHLQPHGLADADALADRDRAGLGVGGEDPAHEEVAALVVGLVRVDDEAEEQPLHGQARAPSGERLVTASWRRAIAGLPASSSITFPSPAVIAISGPTGRAPCDTHAATRTPESASPTAPAPTAPSRRRAACPPCVARARQAADHRQSGVSVGERGEQRLDRERVRVHEQDERVGPVEVRHAADLERARLRLAAPRARTARRRPRPSDAAHTATPPSSTSRASPTTPCAPQPIDARRDAAARRPRPCPPPRAPGSARRRTRRRRRPARLPARARRARPPPRTSRRPRRSSRRPRRI